MTWDFSTEPEFEKKLEWMRTFVMEEVYPLEVLDADEAGFARIIRSLRDEVKSQKLWATHLPPELGGQGYGQVKLGLMHEIEGATMWAPIVFGNEAPDSGNSEVLAHFGTQAQKDRWLYPLLDGRLRSAFSMTEPFTAGSDPTLLSSTARLEGDEWVINGHKWFTSNGMIADFLIAMLVTEPDAGPYERASMIIVPSDAPGLKRLRNIPTMAGESERFGYGHAEILYENVRVPAANLLGKRGQGFLIAQARLGPGRIHHCMRWLGLARRAFDMLCERALQREAFGKKLASHETVQNWIADSAAEMSAAGGGAAQVRGSAGGGHDRRLDDRPRPRSSGRAGTNDCERAGADGGRDCGRAGHAVGDGAGGIRQARRGSCVRVRAGRSVAAAHGQPVLGCADGLQGERPRRLVLRQLRVGLAGHRLLARRRRCGRDFVPGLLAAAEPSRDRRQAGRVRQRRPFFRAGAPVVGRHSLHLKHDAALQFGRAPRAIRQAKGRRHDT